MTRSPTGINVCRKFVRFLAPALGRCQRIVIICIPSLLPQSLHTESAASFCALCNFFKFVRHNFSSEIKLCTKKIEWLRGKNYANCVRMAGKNEENWRSISWTFPLFFCCCCFNVRRETINYFSLLMPTWGFVILWFNRLSTKFNSVHYSSALS